MDGKTPINEEVFQAWHRKRTDAKRRKRDDEAEERKRKGILTGREMFMQEGFTAEDDANAHDDDDREDRADEEKQIAEMMAQVGVCDADAVAVARGARGSLLVDMVRMVMRGCLSEGADGGVMCGDGGVLMVC